MSCGSVPSIAPGGPFTSVRVPSRFTVAQVDEQRRQPLVRQLRNRPAHRDFHIVGMRAEREYVESLCHAHSPWDFVFAPDHCRVIAYL